MIVSASDDYWVLAKPAGIPVNDGPGASGFISLFRTQQGVAQAHPCHRLDQPTSGLLLVAAHEESNRALSQLFQQRLIRKGYLAVTRCRAGAKPLKKQGRVRGDMYKSRGGNWALSKTQANPAVTDFLSWSLGDRYRACLLFPRTGKTHQLRVAMRALGMPIVGDERYGGEASDRLYLHAFALEFDYAAVRRQYRLWPDTGVLFQSSAFLALHQDIETQWESRE